MRDLAKSEWLNLSCLAWPRLWAPEICKGYTQVETSTLPQEPNLKPVMRVFSWSHRVWPSKWKLPLGTFIWYCSLGCKKCFLDKTPVCGRVLFTIMYHYCTNCVMKLECATIHLQNNEQYSNVVYIRFPFHFNSRQYWEWNQSSVCQMHLCPQSQNTHL